MHLWFVHSRAAKITGVFQSKAHLKTTLFSEISSLFWLDGCTKQERAYVTYLRLGRMNSYTLFTAVKPTA